MPVLATRQRKIDEEVVGYLEQTIDTGALAEGQLPSERGLMRPFGVGRPAIRDTPFHLRKMGVEIRPRKSARVTRPAAQFVTESLVSAAQHVIGRPGGVQNFQSARWGMGLAPHAALNVTKEDLADFAEALAVDRQSIGDLKRFRKTDPCRNGDVVEARA